MFWYLSSETAVDGESSLRDGSRKLDPQFNWEDTSAKIQNVQDSLKWQEEKQESFFIRETSKFEKKPHK